MLGAEGALWTEFVTTQDQLDTLLLPRLAALSAVLWDRGTPPDEASFVQRFAVERPVLDAARVRYFVEPPIGLRAKKVFLESATVDLVTPPLFPDGVVRFTLDGSEPTSSSAIWAGPRTFTTTTDLAARLFLAGGPTSPVVRGRVERGVLSPGKAADAAAVARAPIGARYKYYEGDFHQLPDVTKLSPRRSGTAPAIAASQPGFRAERYAVVYEASFHAAADGVYRFVATADDGVAVDVDGVRVVEDDGEHAARESDGEIALGAGLHTVKISYFQGGGGASLALGCGSATESAGGDRACRLLLIP